MLKPSIVYRSNDNLEHYVGLSRLHMLHQLLSSKWFNFSSISRSPISTIFSSILSTTLILQLLCLVTLEKGFYHWEVALPLIITRTLFSSWQSVWLTISPSPFLFNVYISIKLPCYDDITFQYGCLSFLWYRDGIWLENYSLVN